MAIKITESFVERNPDTGDLTSYYVGQIVEGSPSWESQMISEGHAIHYEEGGGGGSFEYETGSITVASSFEDMVISFANSHDRAPDYFLVSRAEYGENPDAGVWVATLSAIDSILNTGTYPTGSYHGDGVFTRIVKSGTSNPSVTGMSTTTEGATKISSFTTAEGITISTNHGSLKGDYKWLALWLDIASDASVA